MDTPEAAPARRGRKRSERARLAILDAGLALVRERGYAATTIDAVAERAGVGKQTVYRWWRTKADVILEALNETATDLIPVPETGPVGVTELSKFLGETFAAAERRPELPDILRALMAAAQLDPEFGARFQANFLARRRAVLRDLLERAMPANRSPADLDKIVDLVYGFTWYRILSGHAPLDRTAADWLAQVAATGIPDGDRSGLTSP